MEQPLFRTLNADEEDPEVTEIESLCIKCFSNVSKQKETVVFLNIYRQNRWPASIIALTAAYYYYVEVIDRFMRFYCVNIKFAEFFLLGYSLILICVLLLFSS